MSLPKLYTEEEAAAYLGKSVITLRRWRKAGLLGYYKLGRDAQYSEAHLLAFLERGTRSPPSAVTAAPPRPGRKKRPPTEAALAAARALLRDEQDPL